MLTGPRTTMWPSASSGSPLRMDTRTWESRSASFAGSFSPVTVQDGCVPCAGSESARPSNDRRRTRTLPGSTRARRLRRHTTSSSQASKVTERSITSSSSRARRLSGRAEIVTWRGCAILVSAARTPISKLGPASAKTSKSMGPASTRRPSMSKETLASVTPSDENGARFISGAGPSRLGKRYFRFASLPSRSTRLMVGFSISMSPASRRPARSENTRGLTERWSATSTGGPPLLLGTSTSSRDTAKGQSCMLT